ncbi:hypothetical protein J1N10_14775 [Carboxylicivirga sp. A043]|nr:hypothetical protein [Carboxylicivirga sp. A043]MCU4157239.1 hypothetical protein [Carboxylicivirga sp. A043]
MKTKRNSVLSKQYHEDQLVHILTSYRFTVDRIRKIISNPSFLKAK